MKAGIKSMPNNICNVKGCTTKGVVRLSGDKIYCANCYTFVISTVFNRGKKHESARRILHNNR